MIKNFSFDLLTLGNRIHHNKNSSLEDKSNVENIDNYFKRTIHRRIYSSRPNKTHERGGGGGVQENGNELTSTDSINDGNPYLSQNKLSHRSFSNGLMFPPEKKGTSNINNLEAHYFGEKKSLLTLKLLIGDKWHVLELSVIGRNTKWLREQIVAYLNTIDSAPPSNIWLVSLSENYFLDEFLHSTNRSIHWFTDTTLELEILKQSSPVYSNQTIKTLRDFRLLKLLGVGGFSKVFLARRLDDGNFFALKIVDLEFVEARDCEHILMNERNILADTNHPFIVKLHHAFKTKNHLVYVLDFCPGGELFYHLKKIKLMPEKIAIFYFIQLCLGVQYLHKCKVIYRDLKPENILIAADGYIKITDFGLSRPEFDPNSLATSFCGSPEYMPPEMISKAGHGFQVDFYCLGAMLYELLTGLPPFYSKDSEEIFRAALNEPITFPNDVQISHNAKDLIRRLMAKNPLERIGSSEKGLEEILAHPALSSYKISDILDKRVNAALKPSVFENYFDPIPETGLKDVYDKIAEDIMYSKYRRKEEVSKKWRKFVYNAEKKRRNNEEDWNKLSRNPGKIQSRKLIMENKSAEFPVKYQEDVFIKNKSYHTGSQKFEEENRAASPEKIKIGSYKEIIKLFNQKKMHNLSAIPFGKALDQTEIINKQDKLEGLANKNTTPTVNLSSYLKKNKITDKSGNKIKFSLKLTEEDKSRLHDLIRRKIPVSQNNLVIENKSLNLINGTSNLFNHSKAKDNNKINAQFRLISDSPPILSNKGNAIPPLSKEKLEQKFLDENFKSKLISFIDRNHRLPVLNQSKLKKNLVNRQSDNGLLQKSIINEKKNF